MKKMDSEILKDEAVTRIDSSTWYDRCDKNAHENLMHIWGCQKSKEIWK